MAATPSWTDWCTLLDGKELPAIVVDLEAMRSNLRTLLESIQSDTLALRLFTPDLPCPALLRQLLLEGAPQVHGLACSSARQAQQLVDLGFDDILVLTPLRSPADADLLVDLSQEGRHIGVLVDSQAHLDLLSQATREGESSLHICMDVDIRARREGVAISPIRDSEQALFLASAIGEAPGLLLEGVRLAGGLPGATSWLSLGRKRSHEGLLDRRLAIVQTLRAEGHALTLVSGGQSRDLALSSTDPALSELDLGGAVLGGQKGIEAMAQTLLPAALLALPVARRPDESHAICAAGGFKELDIKVLSPLGIKALPDQDAGPRQLLFGLETLAPQLALGDPVLIHPRHPGRVMADLDSIFILDGEGQITSAPTLRGL